MDVLAGVTRHIREENKGLSPYILFEVLYVTLTARVQPSLFLVDGETDFLCPRELLVINISGHTERIPLVRVAVPRFELLANRQKVARLPMEPPARPAHGFQ